MREAALADLKQRGVVTQEVQLPGELFAERGFALYEEAFDPRVGNRPLLSPQPPSLPETGREGEKN